MTPLLRVTAADQVPSACVLAVIGGLIMDPSSTRCSEATEINIFMTHS